jgi:lipase maturation factor 1
LESGNFTQMERLKHLALRVFDSREGPPDIFLPRWLFLRALAFIYFSAFFSLLFQIKGLIGPHGILPAGEYLSDVARQFGAARLWFAPSLFWISANSPLLMAVMWLGLIASVAALFNLWPRVSFFVCWLCFLSFVSTASDFSGYQSDGMLLEAGLLALFFVPPGLRPGLGVRSPPARAALWLLQWEWFRIYFESGLVKLLSGDRQWRTLTAMDEYYQNGPLPTWVGWYVEHLPHWFQMATAAGTLGMELVFAFALFLPRRARLVCFCMVTPWEIGVILTANYAFLNYIVLFLGLLLLDDGTLRSLVPAGLKARTLIPAADRAQSFSLPDLSILRVGTTAIFTVWIAYATTALLIEMVLPGAPLPATPIAMLEPFRVANQYGLFAVMTRGRYEIEFQGSNDNQTWTAYRFGHKPQALDEAPRIYAPYQPRFDWNLWFASLGDWRQNQIVPVTEERLLDGDADVLALFKVNPFAESPPKYVRAVLWQYWFTSIEEKRETGNWWRREWLGVYAPVLTRVADGRYEAVQMADELPPHD